MCSQHANDYILLAETPSMHARSSVVRFIQQEVVRPSKQWICNIIEGTQEQDDIILRTEAFILLPDTERVNRYHSGSPRHQRAFSNTPWLVPAAYKSFRDSNNNSNSSNAGMQFTQHKRMLNWLSILNDRRLHTLRDLRGHHVPMLRRMLKSCMSAIETHTGIPRDKVMAYVHYPPSVYQLHVHFSYPYGQYCHRDAYRVHSLESIINNLQIDPNYYAKSTFTLALYKQSLHYAALTGFTPPASDTGSYACKTENVASDARGIEQDDEDTVVAVVAMGVVDKACTVV